MSHVRHKYITVTTFDEDKARLAYQAAIDIGLQVTEIVRAQVNHYWTFFVCPDGSKEGWEPAEQGYELRDKFAAWLLAQSYSDGSNPYEALLVDTGVSEPTNFRPTAKWVGRKP